MKFEYPRNPESWATAKTCKKKLMSRPLYRENNGSLFFIQVSLNCSIVFCTCTFGSYMFYRMDTHLRNAFYVMKDSHLTSIAIERTQALQVCHYNKEFTDNLLHYLIAHINSKPIINVIIFNRKKMIQRLIG